MARITKEIEELIEEYEEIENEITFLEYKKDEIYHKLVKLGMTQKQLEDRCIYNF